MKASSLFALPLTLLLSLSLIVPVAAGSSESATSTYLPFNNQPVANACPPPDVLTANGVVHFVLRVGSDASGGFHLTIEANPRGVTAIDTINNITYTGVGVGTIHVYAAAGAFPMTFQEVDNFIFIAPSQNTIYLHDVLHETVSATGQVTSAFTDVTFTCRP
jgi:hypothetical protein